MTNNVFAQYADNYLTAQTGSMLKCPYCIRGRIPSDRKCYCPDCGGNGYVRPEPEDEDDQPEKTEDDDTRTDM